MGLPVDEARPVRPGEELAVGRLEPFLLSRLPAARGPLAVEQFASGFSNLTYLLRLGDLELVLRRPPFGNRVATAHDMAREHRVLSALAPVYPPAPRPLLYCDDLEVLGAPFFVMERRRGLVLSRELAPRIALPEETGRRLSEALVDHLAVLHRLDAAAAGLADLGRPAGYNRRQVEGWSERYQRARTHDWPALEEVARWLSERVPPESGAAVVHNDFKLDNLVLDPEDPARVVAVLDWEMATLGDPLMDLGTTLAYWVEPGDEELLAAGLMPAAPPGSLSRRELAGRWSAATGADLGNLLYFYAFGLFKVAVIAQQIYRRFAQGATRDPRFARLDAVVGTLGRVARETIDRGEVSPP
jgi:aminoglycoside phosphotransferase (APT) family kinase protein